ncbi:UNVERIFIED_CONTAM: hypothetical protein GTU68_046512 [Idotea baltica]|nr:hypothetical protein [Idotea baltica]
MMYVKHYQK